MCLLLIEMDYSPHFDLTHLRAPISAHLELTDSCTNYCRFCYNPQRHNRIVQKQDVLSQKDFIEITRKLGESGLFEIILTGGEPLIRRDSIGPILEEGRNYNLQFSINSNLVVLNDDDIEIFKRSKLSSILTSIHHPEPEKHDKIVGVPDAWNKTMSSIIKLKNNGFEPYVNMVVTRDTTDFVYFLGEKLHKEFGLRKFSATPTSPTVEEGTGDMLSINEIKRTLDQLLKLESDFGIEVDVLETIPYCSISEDRYFSFFNRGCSAGRTSIAVSSNGDVRACTHDSRSYGNLLKEELVDIWKNMSAWRSNEFIPSGCSEKCEEYTSCYGGCRVLAELISEKINGKDPYMEEPLRIVLKRSKTQEFDAESSYVLDKNIRYRHEFNDIYCVINSRRGLIFGNGELIRMFDFLSKRDSFSVGGLCVELGEKSEEVQGIIKFLNSHYFVKKP